MNWWLSLFSTAVVSCLYWTLVIALPGWLVTHSVRITKSLRFSLVGIVGLSLYALVSLLSFRISSNYLISDSLMAGLGFLALKKLWPFQAVKLPTVSASSVLGLMIVCFTLSVQSMVLWRSARPMETGVGFVELSFHDSMQHLAIIDRLSPGSTLTHPGFGGEEVRNYHYLIDVVLAATNRVPGVDLWHLYYRVYPIGIGVLVIAAVVGTTWFLTKSMTAAWISYPLMFLSGNASPFLALFRGDEFRPSANALMMNPLVDIMQNPAATLIIGVFLVFIGLLHQAYQRRLGNPWLYILSLSLLVGVSFSFKAWGGFVMGLILAAAAVVQVIRTRRPSLLICGVVALAILGISFFDGYDPETAAGFSFAPMWLVTKMVEDADRWNNLPELFQSQAYQYQQDWIGLGRLYTKWLLVFFVGNLSLRALGLAAFGWWIVSSRYRAWGLVSVATLLVTWPMLVLFNNSQMAYDIEQFAPYGLVVASLGLMFLISKLLPRPLILPISILLIGLMIPANFSSIRARTMGQVRLVSTASLQTFTQLRSLVGDHAIVAIPPSGDTIATLAFAALTGKDTYFSGRTFSIITGHDWELRKKQLEHWFSDKRLDGANFESMQQEGISYVYLSNTESQEYEFQSNKVVSLPDGVLIDISPDK